MGALAGKLKGSYMDKLPAIHGIVCDVNPWIKHNQHYRTTAPGLQDVMTAIFYRVLAAVTILKLDVIKAPWRIKVLQNNWKYMIKGKTRENTVGTYGVASAQHHWGRMAALILRLLYYTFPQIL